MKNAFEPVESLNIFPQAIRLINCPPTWTGHEVCPTFNRFFYVLDGGFVLNVENHSYFVKKNQLALLPKGKEHIFWLLPDRNMSMIDVGFNSERLDTDLFEYYGLADDNHVVDIPEEKMLSIFNAANQPSSPSIIIPFYITLCSEIAKLCSLYVEARMLGDNAEAEYAPITEYMRAHISEDVSLEELASIMHLEATYFSAKFKRATGLSPIKYLGEMRAMEAARLLRDTNMSIGEIASCIGFDNKYRFNTFFLNSMGLLPDKYRAAFVMPPYLGESEDSI